METEDTIGIQHAINLGPTKDVSNSLKSAIKEGKIHLIREIINTCCEEFKIESMSGVIKALPELAVKYPSMVSYFLEKSTYREVPETFDRSNALDTTVLGTAYSGTDFSFFAYSFDPFRVRFFHSTTNIDYSTDYYAPMPPLDVFDTLVYYRSINTFQSPIYEAIVMNMFEDGKFWCYFMGIMTYYIIHLGIFVAVISDTNGNKGLMIASIFFGSVMMFLWIRIPLLSYCKFLRLLAQKRLWAPRTFIFKTWHILVEFTAIVLPVITASLEYHNNITPPELRSVSILFMWIYIVFQLRLFQGIGIFIAVFEEIIWKIKFLLLFLLFILFSFAHSLLILLSETPPDPNTSNSFTSFDQSLKNVWSMLLNDYSSLSPWSNNRLLDIFKIVFSFSTAIVIFNILIAVMNNTYEEVYKNARAVWIAQIAEMVSNYRFGVGHRKKEYEYIIYNASPNNIHEHEYNMILKEIRNLKTEKKI